MPQALTRRRLPRQQQQDKFVKSLTNGMYVHSSPPRVLQLNAAYIKQLIRTGDFDKLEALVYDGQGKRLLEESSTDPKIKNFLNNLPALMAKISLLHDAVNSGRLEELQSVLDGENEKTRKRLINAKDEAGVGLLHKAIYYDLKDVSEWIIKNYPNAATSKDAEGRTPYHYTPMCQNVSFMQKLLKVAGADPASLDNRQKTAKYYKDHISELELPSAHKSRYNSKKGTTSSDSLNIKKSNIRIWIHQRDLKSLQQVIWEGHGNKLLVEHSNNPKVKKFLEAVPHILCAIKDVHSDVVQDNLDAFKEHTRAPAPNMIYIAKDVNGLTPLHKAAGLGRQEIAEYIIAQNPKSLSCTDNEGRTPLHYSVILKDGGKMFDYLVEAGADEGTVDNKSKSAGFYKTRTNEIDGKLLQFIPESPRKAKDGTFDWSILGVAATPLEDVDKVITNGNGQNGRKKRSTGNTETKNENLEEDKEQKNGNAEEDNPETPKEEPQEPPEIETNDNPAAEESEQTEEGPQNAESSDINNTEDQTNEDSEPPAQNPEPEPASYSEPEEPEPTQTSDPLSQPDPDPEPETTDDDPKNSETTTDDDQADRETAIVEAESVIEGVVNGENEIENEQGVSADDKDSVDIKAMIESGNMEQLANLVLSGEGDRLMGETSDVPEIQSFLSNVPVYISKINRIHMAARDGSLKELQAALDRRKFAIAKDKMSTNGATPLHVATVFGNTSIVRYLAGRFPETVAVTDDNGRTPLHYAAVVPDNGHYYNLLVHLGANTRAEDKFGHTPEFYKNNQGEFGHRSILAGFGAEELADEMLTDKDASNAQVEMPFFCTEEGRYLASSLGDPLIKGLTEVANTRPSDPIAYLAQYLYNFASTNNNKPRPRTQENARIANGSANNQTGDNVPANIEVVTVDPDDSQAENDSAFNPTSRDEHGQSMLHFATARSHGRNALFQLLMETNINIGYRDQLYRTARDISVQAAIPENTVEIDRYVLQIATKGDTDKLVELLLDGYDHIIDIIDEEGVPIVETVENAEQPETVAFLHSILAFEERRERVHHAIREGNLTLIKEMLADESNTGSGRLLAIGKNSYGRCTLHVAVLCQQEEIVDYLANTFPETLKIGDNLERTALHYAMGIEKIESVSKVLIKAGAKRVTKDLKGRQPTYYFMNKADILRLQEEEETF